MQRYALEVGSATFPKTRFALYDFSEANFTPHFAISSEGHVSEATVGSLRYSGTFSPTSSPRHAETVHEVSKDYLRIPTCSSTADSVLTWPIFQGRFPSDYLIEILLDPTSRQPDAGTGADALVVPGGLEPLADERIPSLIDKFLENVHSKNPVLDVEALVHYGRRAAAGGLGWDAPSCLVLLACALGSIAVPFVVSEANQHEIEMNAPGITSSSIFTKEIKQAESCYALACRRLGLLKHTILGAHCYFFSAGQSASGYFEWLLNAVVVYLMYTLRPLPAWNHFCQASTFYQIHSRTIARPSHGAMLDSHLNGMSVTQRRLEQSLYWSCFKSECEMRIELPLPQSSLADVDYPHMFPNPPAHPTENPGFRHPDSDTFSFDWETRPSNSMANIEEVSWYYYLTEVALRRIGNRILNTFFRQNHSSWLDIKPFIPIAKEFEEQVLVWASNLPPAMQYDKNPTDELSSSRELSWATWNRLLEMKTWLYQPFLYYAVHCDAEASELRENADLHSLINAAMDCNISTIENRTLRHRHHGIWFDIRSIITASFTVIAAAKSGKVKVQEEWEDRIKSVIDTLAFWEDEAIDLVKTRAVLEELFLETRDLIRQQRC